MIGPPQTSVGTSTFAALAFCILFAGLPGAATPLGAIGYDDAEHQLRNGASAVVWYLGHSGWAVRTKNHLLVFDYWEYRKRTPEDGIATGFIDPSEVADSKIRVFVSHSHGDHYDPVILEWKKHAADVKYVFGWNPEGLSPDVTFGTDRKSVTLDDMKIFPVHHSFDGLPESAFLVSVDGLLIYHAGDHGHSKGAENPAYKANIDYLASLNDHIDLAFFPMFGGADYAIDKLAPRVAVPMHNRGGERVYSEFKHHATSRHPEVRVFAAAKPGDSFKYGEDPRWK